MNECLTVMKFFVIQYPPGFAAGSQWRATENWRGKEIQNMRQFL